MSRRMGHISGRMLSLRRCYHIGSSVAKSAPWSTHTSRMQRIGRGRCSKPPGQLEGADSKSVPGGCEAHAAWGHKRQGADSRFPHFSGFQPPAYN